MAAQRLPYIPETITVHLGRPNEAAENITVSFPDYIKNVASSEIYPTWPESAIRANIYAQITYALNRVYNEFYRSQGYDFDITNTTQYDQKFIKDREIFDNINTIVDEIFDNYVVRQGRIEPYFTAYCNGTTSTCDGLSQWGTVYLAEQGYTPYGILQYYYGEDIGIVEDAPVASNTESYPGFPLRLGSSGNPVRTIQLELNRVSENYPAIPKIGDPNGVFGVDTEEAVRKFQQIFSLTQDGIVGKATWYKLKYIYNGVKRLNELTSEGLTIQDVTLPYPELLKEGMQGEEVKVIQYYLNVISYFYPEVPTIALDGYFGPETKAAVTAFQRLSSLVEDGVMGKDTWYSLEKAYRAIMASLPPNYESSKVVIYPGYVLSEGLENEDVRLLQGYLREIAQYYGTIPLIEETGVFDEATKDAVYALQQQEGITPTGTVGPVTWARIAWLYDTR